MESFDPEKEDWNACTERFEQFILTNGVEGEKKVVATFLTTVGSETYNLVRDLLAPAKPSTMKYAELVETLQSHYEPKPLIIAERFHFHKRDQLEGESVAEYSAVLKKCSERCEFKAFLGEALRDRFVCGLRSKATQKRLLAEVELTWKKAIQTAQAMEAAEKQASNFRNAPPHMEKVNALKSLPKNNPNFKRSGAGKTSKPCFRCGENHAPQTCRFKEEQCRYCKGKGHIMRVCKKKASDATKGNAPTQRSSSQRLSVQYLNKQEEQDDEFQIFKIGQTAPEPSIIIPLEINGVPVPMELDTGASLTVISETLWKEKFPTSTLEPSNIRLKTYTSEELKVVG